MNAVTGAPASRPAPPHRSGVIQESRQLPAGNVFEDQLGLDVGDFLAGCERGHRQIPQVLRVPCPDMHQKVDRAGHVIEAHDFGQFEGVLAEGEDALELITMAMTLVPWLRDSGPASGADQVVLKVVEPQAAIARAPAMPRRPAASSR